MKKVNWEAGEMLYEALKQTPPEGLPELLGAHAEELLSGQRPFADYMRARFREKGVLQQNVFLAADLSENYGYKLVAGEKHTVKRDVIVRICLAARFDPDETQKALILYGMAPLCCLLPRDAVLLWALLHREFDVHRVNALLLRCGLAPLLDGVG